MLRVVGVPKGKLEELGGAQCDVNRVLGGDGQAQRAGDALRLRALPIGRDDLQVAGVLRADALLSLRDTGAKPGPSPGRALLLKGWSATSPTPTQNTKFLLESPPPLPQAPELDGTGPPPGPEDREWVYTALLASLCPAAVSPVGGGVCPACSQLSPGLEAGNWAQWGIRSRGF